MRALLPRLPGPRLTGLLHAQDPARAAPGATTKHSSRWAATQQALIAIQHDGTIYQSKSAPYGLTNNVGPSVIADESDAATAKPDCLI